MTEQLPTWLSYLQALGPLIIGACTVAIGLSVAYVAWRQWETARHKLRLELFDRRLKVYRDVAKLQAVAVHGSLSQEDFNTTVQACINMEFLFDDRTFQAVNEYLGTIVVFAGERSPTHEERKQAMDKWPAIREAFARYLDLSKLG